MDKKKSIQSTRQLAGKLSDQDVQPFDDQVLPLLPLKNMVLLPKSILPVIVGRESSIRAVEHALKNDKLIFITSQISPDTESPTIKDLFSYGTKATILQVMRMSNGSLKILVEGLQRCRVTKDILCDGFTGVLFED